ncbi:MAG TPA: hypothetical protein PKY03_07540 [Moraxellaceae bacterium]|nr:hypothetical protein [Moraxellaceae bacterium]
MKILQGARNLIWLFATFLLAACGGGDSSVPLAGISANSLSLTLSASNVTAATPVTVRATVLGPAPANAPVSGQSVSFGTQLGTLVSGSQSGVTVTAVTDASGVAVVQLTAGSVSGEGAVVARFTDKEGNTRQASQVFLMSGDGASPGTGGGTTPVTLRVAVALLDAAGNPTGTASSKISAANPATVRVTATRNGAPVPDQVVSVDSDLGVVNPSSGTALTDAAGVATLSLRAGTVEGAGTLTASFANNEGSATISKTFSTLGDEGASGSTGAGLKLTLALRNQSDTANINSITAASPGLLRARLVDAAGTPQPEKVLVFSSSLGNINPASGTALTDGSGFAVVNLSAGSVGGAGTARVVFGTTSAEVGFRTDGSGGSASSGSLEGVGLFSAATGGGSLSTITSSQDGFFRVRARDANGVLLPNAIISFSADVGELQPSNGRALTGSDGVAVIQIKAGSSEGPGEVIASTSINDAVVSIRQVLEVKQDVIALGSDNGTGFVSGTLRVAASLSAGATVPVEARLRNVTAGGAYSAPIEVRFKSQCALNATAELEGTAIAQNGVAMVAYTPKTGCASDVITAEALLNGVTKTAVSPTLTIAEAPAASIRFVSATPTTIAIKGTGGSGRSESAEVVFEVSNELGQPVGSGKSVQFTLSTSIGGLALAGSSIAQTDASGRVRATVLAGTVPTPVRVIAKLLEGAQPQTVSDALSVSTGLPVQKGMSLSASSFNPADAYEQDGVGVVVTAYASDYFGNPVPDGTSIQFLTEQGQIDSGCQTVNGRCSVDWTSAAPRALNGRGTILAYAIGEEDFVDQNGNNRFDAGEAHTDLGEAFLDKNENGLFDAGEVFKDFNNNGVFDGGAAFDVGYNGSLCLDGDAVNCRSLVHIRQSLVMAMPTRSVIAKVYDASCVTEVSSVSLAALPQTLCVKVTDGNGNAPGEGTKVELNPGSAVNIGASSYIVPGTSPEVFVRRFVLGAPGTPPTSLAPALLTVTPLTAEPVLKTLLVTP